MKSPEDVAARPRRTPPPAVESLEGRRLLSHPGPPLSTPSYAGQADVGATTVGPSLGPGSQLLASRLEMGSWREVLVKVEVAPEAAGPPGSIAPFDHWAASKAPPSWGIEARGPVVVPAVGLFVLIDQPDAPPTGPKFRPDAYEARTGNGPLIGTDGPARPTREEAASLAAVAVSPASGSVPAGPSHAATAAVGPGGRGPTAVVPGGQDRLAVSVGDAGGREDRVLAMPGPAGSSPAARPIGPSRGAAGTKGRAISPGVEARDEDRDPTASEAPDPQGAGPLTDFLPFDRASLDLALDRFLGQFDAIGDALPDLPAPIDLVPAPLALAVSVLASDAALRLRRRAGDGEDDGEAGPARFPGLPGPWSADPT